MALTRLNVNNAFSATLPVSKGGTGVTSAADLANTGHMVLLEEHIADETITEIVLDNTQVIDTYETYLIILTGVQLSSDNVDIALRMSSDNGSNYKSSYDRCTPFSLASDSNNGNVTKKTGTESYVQITGTNNSLGGNGRESCSAYVYLFGLRDSGVNKQVFKHSVYRNTAGNAMFNLGINELNSADVINNFKIYTGNGTSTFSRGKISIYGMK